MLKLCGRSFLVGDVLKIERVDDKVMVVCIEEVFGEDEFKCWDIFGQDSWEGVPCLVMSRMRSNEVRAVRKLGEIPDAHRDAYIKFMLMYQRVKEWEKELL